MIKGLVSVVIPCYNQGAYLAEALESVISQSYKEWECIIINDGSSDQTEEIALVFTEKDGRIRYISQENAGVISARNRAIASSNGEFVLPLDADDTIAPFYLEKVVRVLQTDPACKIVYGKGWLTGEKNEPFLLPPFSIKGLLRDNCIFNSAVFRRQDFDAVGGYNSNMKTGYEDWNLWLSLLEDGGYAHQLEETVYFYRILPHSRTSGADRNEEQLRLQIISNHPRLYMEHYIQLYEWYALLSPSRWWFRISTAFSRFMFKIRK